MTQRALANLFYRNLQFLHLPALGDTLHSSTEIVGLRRAAAKPGRGPRGLAVMRIRTQDGQHRPVLDYFRCALLPTRQASDAAPAGLLDPPIAAFTTAGAAEAWNLGAFAAGQGQRRPPAHEGETRTMPGDLVSSAPELARLTLNLAAVHHDSGVAGGTRLVYGGHAIGIAAAQASRAWPDLVTILGWTSCDHLGPVREGDVLRTTLAVESVRPLAAGRLASVRALVRADRDEEPVLDWRFTALFA